MLQHEGNGCTIDQSVSGFSDILIGFSPHLKLVAFFFFLTRFRLSLSLECSGKIFSKIRQICMPSKFARGGCIPPKIKCEI